MNSSIFIYINSGCIQSQILLFSSLMFLLMTKDLRPLDNALGNLLGLFNEIMVYLTLSAQFLMCDRS